MTNNSKLEPGDRVTTPEGNGTVKFTSDYSVGQYADVLLDSGDFKKFPSATILRINEI